MELVCDLRERNSTLDLFSSWVKKDTLTVGDYAIKFDGEVKFIFERKTWKDLAGSIKDKRVYKQISNMQGLPCNKVFIIEGSMGYKDDVVIDGIPFFKLNAFVNKLYILDFQVKQTKDPVHTVKFLEAFAKQYANESYKKSGASENSIKEVKKLTNEECRRKILLSIKGIGENMVTVFPFTIKKLLMESFTNELFIDELSLVKYVSGRKIGVKPAQKIITYIKDKENHAKILEEFPGISKTSAKYILACISLQDICADNFLEVSYNIYKTDNMKMGDKLAEKIITLINL